MRRTNHILLAAAMLSATATAALATPSFRPSLPSHAMAPAPADAAGLAAIQCVLGDQGDLTGCKLVKEEPAGMGLGDAALSAAHLLKLDGRRAGEVVTIPMRFKIAPKTGEASATSEASLPTP